MQSPSSKVAISDSAQFRLCSHHHPKVAAIDCASGLLQTAHDQGYIVKHLLAGLPQVTERVKTMRQGRNGNMSEEAKDRMFASQEAYIKVRRPGATLSSEQGLPFR
jgi:hypothetical protein